MSVAGIEHLPCGFGRALSYFRSGPSLVATIGVYRRGGGAIVTVQCKGRQPHRYKVSLHRYHAFRQWVAFASHPWKSSGVWLKSCLNAFLLQPTP